jgi:hypothetical protein
MKKTLIIFCVALGFLLPGQSAFAVDIASLEGEANSNAFQQVAAPVYAETNQTSNVDLSLSTSTGNVVVADKTSNAIGNSISIELLGSSGFEPTGSGLSSVSTSAPASGQLVQGLSSGFRILNVMEDSTATSRKCSKPWMLSWVTKSSDQ